MTARSLPRLILPAVLAAAITIAASGCASTPPAPPSTPSGQPTATVAPSDPGQQPEPGETPDTVDPADVTCESLIGPDLVTELTDQGWTAREDPLFIGDLELSDGISCTWGDFESTTGEDLLLFAWSPITAEQATAAEAALSTEGWIVEEGADGTYVTEDPSQAINLDDEGYGMTYLFGDGWVILSDTKQGLVLIERPGA